MDVTLLREITTVVCLAVFVGIVAWAYSRRNTADFEQAARLPLERD